MQAIPRNPPAPRRYASAPASARSLRRNNVCICRTRTRVVSGCMAPSEPRCPHIRGQSQSPPRQSGHMLLSRMRFPAGLRGVRHALRTVKPRERGVCQVDCFRHTGSPDLLMVGTPQLDCGQGARRISEPRWFPWRDSAGHSTNQLVIRRKRGERHLRNGDQPVTVHGVMAR